MFSMNRDDMGPTLLILVKPLIFMDMLAVSEGLYNLSSHSSCIWDDVLCLPDLYVYRNL